MDSALRSLEFDRVLELISVEAKSQPGRRALGLRSPARSRQACEEAQAALAEMVSYYEGEGLLPLAGLIEVEPIYTKESLDLEDAWQILRSARATQAIRESFLRLQAPSPRLLEIARRIDDLGDLVSAVGRYFTKEGKLREDATPELRSIRQRIHAKRAQIQKTLVDLMNRHGEAIQEPIITMRGERYCIPVRTERRGDLPGILHERSGSGASVFIEPMPTVELNNDLAELLQQERAEIARLTILIAQQLRSASERVVVAVEISGELDAIQACAVFHRQCQATRPLFTDERRLELLEARHPLLDERLASLRQSAFGERDQSRVVPTTLLLNPDSPALVISGPNAGGKTVALKTAGLLSAMAMSGLPLPAAEGSVIPMVDSFHVLIGDDQDLLLHLSTFSAYLMRLKRILASANERSMVLLDELGSGTDPEEGGALAAAVIEHLLELGCLLIATTHLNALKNFAIQDPRIANASMEFDPESGTPTFRLIQGIPGRSRALEVAAMIGLPQQILEAARARLGDQHGEVDRLLAELQKEMRAVQEERGRLQQLSGEMERHAEAARQRSEALEKERRTVVKGVREELDRTEREVRQRLDQEIRRLRAIDRQERERVQAAQVVSTVVEPIDRFTVAETPRRPVRVGDRVEHRRLRLTGTVASIEGARVHLAAAGKRIQVELADLIPLEEPPPPKRQPQRRPDQPLAEPEVAAELNLIGQRVEEALEQSDKFIDRSLLAGKGAIRLIHGYGTGALRKALRDFLRQHRGVKSFRPGNEKEGGDGATVAILDV